MLGGVLKKVLLVLLVVVVIQNWGKIERLFNPSQVVSEQTRASARVALYATEWCGYCKQIRRFLDQGQPEIGEKAHAGRNVIDWIANCHDCAGVGQVKARRLYDRFGPDLVDLIEQRVQILQHRRATGVGEAHLFEGQAARRGQGLADDGLGQRRLTQDAHQLIQVVAGHAQ